MHYSRGGSIGEGSATMASHGSQRHHGSAGSSPDFVGGYESTEYTDSPPDTSRGQTGSAYTPHSYGNTPPSLEASYAGAPVATGGSYHHSYTGASGDAYGHSAAHDHTYHSGGAGAGYYHEPSHTEAKSYSVAPPSSDYPPQATRGYSNTTPTNWRSNTYPFTTTPSRPRHSNSPPLSPLDTRSASYFPSSTRDYPVSAIPPGPSSPTTPSSVSDSPSTPFSPHYSSPSYHGHSHSHSSSASATYIHGTPLPPLQLSGTGVSGGHFVPPVGSEHPVPVSAYSASPTHAANPYVRYSPPERSQTAPQSQQSATPYAGGSTARPFLCDDCGMNFARTHDLKRHQTTHVAGVKKTHPCPYCGKNLSRRDAIKRHVVSKQCPVATEKGYGWPPPEGHVPPLPDTAIDRTSHKRGENPYPVVSVSPERSTGGPYGYSNGTPSPGPYSPSGYGYGSASGPGYDHNAPGMGPGPQTAVVFEYDHRSSGYKGR